MAPTRLGTNYTSTTSARQGYQETIDDGSSAQQASEADASNTNPGGMDVDIRQPLVTDDSPPPPSSNGRHDAATTVIVTQPPSTSNGMFGVDGDSALFPSSSVGANYSTENRQAALLPMSQQQWTANGTMYQQPPMNLPMYQTAAYPFTNIGLHRDPIPPTPFAFDPWMNNSFGRMPMDYFPPYQPPGLSGYSSAAVLDGSGTTAGHSGRSNAAPLDGTSNTTVAQEGSSNLFESLRRRTVIDKFGSSTDMPAELWIVLFDQATDGLSDKERIQLLMTYLTKDSLRWYAQFVAPFKHAYKWPMVKSLFLDKFAHTSIKPIVAAKERILKKHEVIQSYFDDKTRLMELAGLPRGSMLDLLTDGLPPSYRHVLASRDPRSLFEWSRCAQSIESSNGRFDHRSDNRTDTQAVNVSSTYNRSEAKPVKRDSRHLEETTPTDPCPRCLQHGKTEYHWARTCSYPPRRWDGQVPKKTPASSSLNSRSGPNAV